jgi:hypothetical protein
VTQPSNDDERRALWDEINELKKERAQLRRQLDAIADSGAAATTVPSKTADSVGDSDERGRPVLVPRYETYAQQALRGLPRQVQVDTIMAASQLATGDAGTWRGVKQAKDMRRPLYLARVAHEYRLLFRLDGGALVLVDVVQRSQMPHAIDQLRSQG